MTAKQLARKWEKALRRSRRRNAEALAAMLAEMSEEWCESGNGQPYPDEVAVVEGYVIVAGLDGGKEYAAPTLTVYGPEEVGKWLSEIRTYRRENPDCELWEAIEETRP